MNCFFPLCRSQPVLSWRSWSWAEWEMSRAQENLDVRMGLRTPVLPPEGDVMNSSPRPPVQSLQVLSRDLSGGCGVDRHVEGRWPVSGSMWSPSGLKGSSQSKFLRREEGNRDGSSHSAGKGRAGDERPCVCSPVSASVYLSICAGICSTLAGVEGVDTRPCEIRHCPSAPRVLMPRTIPQTSFANPSSSPISPIFTPEMEILTGFQEVPGEVRIVCPSLISTCTLASRDLMGSSWTDSS